MLFNEPKLLKFAYGFTVEEVLESFSALQRAEIAEIANVVFDIVVIPRVSVLFNEPKLLKSQGLQRRPANVQVSVLFNEPKLLKSSSVWRISSAPNVSVLFNEPKLLKS